ncbi:MAG: VOC family protein, partial [Bacteroidaceae bacterium]|nr:VOC family protein [Bacteroidaceae bacterium]
TKTFYVTDLEGNWFQMVPDSSVVVNENKLFGGMVGAMIGVTNIEKSLEVYRDVLGYDVVVYDKTGTFNDLSYLLGGDTRFRRVLLKWSKPVEGAFSSMFTSGYIELVQALERIPKKIFEGRYWGDPGFLQVCYDITNMDAFGEHCKQKGYPFTVDSCPDGVQFNMGDASGRFTYIEDPDGTLIEFVETYRVGIAKKLNLYLNLMKRNRKKPLPKFLFKAMRMNRMKFKD